MTTKQQILQAADQLFYQQGYEHTSFADIAAAVQISRGNFYYHFKTKDAILDGVIEYRLAKTEAMLQKWTVDGETPSDRIRSFIHILLVNGKKIKQFGCPVGTLSSELAKLNHPAKEDANRLFSLFHTWLKQQFGELGYQDQADEFAMHLLARSQGVATLANAFQNDEFVQQEVQQMCQWLENLPQSRTAKETV